VAVLEAESGDVERFRLSVEQCESCVVLDECSGYTYNEAASYNGSRRSSVRRPTIGRLSIESVSKSLSRLAARYDSTGVGVGVHTMEGEHAPLVTCTTHQDCVPQISLCLIQL